MTSMKTESATSQGIAVRELDSPVGKIRITASEAGVREAWFVEADEAAVERPSMNDEPAQARAHAESGVRQLTEYFAGTRREFDLPIDQRGTEFERSAWNELCRIPFGVTISYGEEAKRLGNPAAVRAVGRANGRNQVAIIVPCHRVIGADGSLTGYGGGVERKKWLLSFEREGLFGGPATLSGSEQPATHQ